MKSMQRIHENFKRKKDKMEPPDVCLGAAIAKMTLNNSKMSRAGCNSTLTKKHHSIACHCSKEAVAARTVRVSKEHASTNLADIFMTKTVAEPKREEPLDSFAC
jgi:hypothetical protein